MVELKLRWTKHCIFYVAGTDYANGNNDDDSIIFTIKYTKLYVSILSLYTRVNQNLSKIYWNEYKTKSENKNTTNEYRYFLESNFVIVNRLSF